MRPQTRFFTTGVAAITAALLSSSAAFAQIDGDAVFERLAAQMALQGIIIEADQIQTDGNDVIVAGLKAQMAPETDAVPLGSHALENVSETEDGSYLVELVAISPFDYTEDGVTVNFEGGEINNYLIAGADVTDPVLRSGLFTSMDAGPLTVSDDDGTIFSMESAEVTSSNYEPGEVMTFTANANNMVGDMTRLPEVEARETMAALGYEELRGDFISSGSWDPATGQMIIDELTYSVEEAADLSISMDIGGYTTELVGALQDMQAQMADQSEEAMAMGMLGLMQQLEINAMAIELDDASLTNRILDFVAAQQGMDRPSIIAMAKGIVPMGLAQLGNPAFAASVSAATSTFLDDPQSLRIAAEPENPVPVAALMAAAMSSPQSLIDVLAVNVTANQ